MSLIFPTILLGNNLSETDQNELSLFKKTPDEMVIDYSKDNQVLSLTHHSKFGAVQKLNAFEVALALKLKNEYWVQGFVAFGSTTFGNSSENQTSQGSPNAEAEEYYQRSKTDKSGLFYFGLGIGKTFQAFGDFFNSHRLRERIFVHPTYILMSDDLRNTNYSGYGLRADYELAYRVGQNFGFGFKLTYGISATKRGQKFENEPSSDRSLMVRWLSSALSLNFYL